LLQAGGVNPDEALRKLEAIDAQPYYEPPAAPVDTDLEVGFPVPLYFLGEIYPPNFGQLLTTGVTVIS